MSRKSSSRKVKKEEIRDHASEDFIKIPMEPRITKDTRKLRGSYNELRDWIKDPKGYFLVRLDHDKQELEAGFCREENLVEVIISGKKPQDIYFTAIQEGLISRLDHAAYLGKELEKAFIAMRSGRNYVQDLELE